MNNIADLVREVLTGRREKYAGIVREYQDMLLAYTAFRVPDADLTDEIVQQTFIRAYQQLSDYRPDGDFGVWLRAIAKFVIMAELKRCSREGQNRENYREHIRSRLAEAMLQNDFKGPSDIQTERLEQCIGKLQEESRRVLEFRYREDMKMNEIAERMGKTVNWVTVTLFRIRAALRECMKRQTFDEVAS